MTINPLAYAITHEAIPSIYIQKFNIICYSFVRSVCVLGGGIANPIENEYTKHSNIIDQNRPDNICNLTWHLDIMFGINKYNLTYLCWGLLPATRITPDIIVVSHLLHHNCESHNISSPPSPVHTHVWSPIILLVHCISVE